MARLLPKNSISLRAFIATLQVAGVVAVGMVLDASTVRGEGVGKRWAIALHGGAGQLSREMSSELQQQYEQSLAAALETGKQILASGGSALDAVEATVIALEDAPLFNAGRGAAFTRAGEHELDASIMDGSTLQCGGVAMVRNLKNPVIAARLVMQKTPHVLLSGLGAEDFAVANGCDVVEQSYFYTPTRFNKLQTKLKSLGLPLLKKPAYEIDSAAAATSSSSGHVDSHIYESGGTVGCVACDRHGKLAAATSTGGLTGKLAGRIGDSPINGAGNYANKFAAVSGTGKGEQFIRHSIAARVAWLVEEKEMTLEYAVNHCLKEVLDVGDGGLIAVDGQGNLYLNSTTGTLPRGWADSSGRFDVAIWFKE